MGSAIATAFTTGLTTFGPDIGLVVAAIAGMYVTIRISRALLGFIKK